MRSAPPVVYPVGRFVWGTRFLLALAVFSAVFLLGLWRETAYSVVLGWTGLVVWALAALLGWRLWGRETLPPGELRWDGAGWTHQAQEGVATPVHVAVLWDVGQALLVQVKAVQEHRGGPRCAWLAEKQSPALWHACRCAVFGRDIL